METTALKLLLLSCTHHLLSPASSLLLIPKLIARLSQKLSAPTSGYLSLHLLMWMLQCAMLTLVSLEISQISAALLVFSGC
ncbi:unnamed protein product [Cuscuta campestris]|uniref:Uncharacterized protein n=1 Tax=Cuscuta campestris TaxID=132261 RepID=A0A484N6Z4_9ASTE|nr:unnamed protein product [Cuscuta campestris]